MRNALISVFRIFSRGPFALLLLFGLVSNSSSAGLTSVEIQGFRLNQCGAKTCLTITAETAYEGIVPGSYASGRSIVKFSEKKTGREIVYESNDLYYDVFSEKLFIRDISSAPGTEVVYDLRNESTSLYQF